MRRLSTLLFILLVALAPASCGFVGLGNVTVSWDEDVTLQSGQILAVQRELKIGPDEWGRAGRGRLQEQSIAFVTNGTRVRWNNDDPWPIAYLPDTLEMVNGVPMIVMPVHQWGPCFKYDFPQEGLVAFGFQDGQWQRMPLQKIPEGVKVNLLRSTDAIRHRSEYKNRRIDAKAKVTLESDIWGPKQGTPLAESALFYADLDESCARIRPLPNRQLEEARQRNTDAERNAPMIRATVVSVTSEPESVSGKDFTEQRGIWSGVGYLTTSCKGIVEKLEAVRQWSGDDKGSRSVLAGYQLIIAHTPQRRIQIYETNRAQMQCVVCDQTAIYAVRRQDKEQLILHRFSHDGDLIDAFRVFLPETSKITAGSDRGTLWQVASDATGDLAISVADYTYPQLANLGGTINRKVNYVVQLPSPPPRAVP